MEVSLLVAGTKIWWEILVKIYIRELAEVFD
jgi:hypothetical protein